MISQERLLTCGDSRAEEHLSSLELPQRSSVGDLETSSGRNPALRAEAPWKPSRVPVGGVLQPHLVPEGLKQTRKMNIEVHICWFALGSCRNTVKQSGNSVS